MAHAAQVGKDHSADTVFDIPAAAKLGEYNVTLDNGAASADASANDEDADSGVTQSYDSGSFRVEEFRLPVFKGSIKAGDTKAPGLVAATEAPVNVQLGYVQGDPASNLPVQLSAAGRVAMHRRLRVAIRGVQWRTESQARER